MKSMKERRWYKKRPCTNRCWLFSNETIEMESMNLQFLSFHSWKVNTGSIGLILIIIL